MPTGTAAHTTARIVEAKHAGVKLRNYLVQEFRDILLVRSDMIAALRQKRVLVDGQITLDSHVLQPGNCVQVTIDPAQAIKSRLRGLDVELRYSEPGLAILLKAPGVSQPDVEWAAPAMLGVGGSEIEPWIAVNKVEKGVRSLAILVDTQDKKERMLEHIRTGSVRFGIAALCHGCVDQQAVSSATTASMKKAALLHKPAGAEALLESDVPTMFEYDLWLQYNRLPADVFDHVQVSVRSVVPSPAVRHLSLVEGVVAKALNPSLVLRRFMYEMNYPIVGTQNHSRPLPNHRDKGALLAFIRVELPSLSNPEKSIAVHADVPQKLLSVCTREAKFFEQRKKKTQAEISRLVSDSDLLESKPVEGASVEEVELVDGVPAAYVSGKKEFCGNVFYVTRDTLIPRTSTQTLVEATVQYAGLAAAKPRLMDLGTGSGCILFSALLRFPESVGVGIDISAEALAVAEKNRQLHGLQNRAVLIESSFEAFATDAQVQKQGPFDFIACNPPYISVKKASRMGAAIEYEPGLALVAEDNGYQAYRAICRAISSNPSILRQGGLIGFEIGKGMERGVRKIFQDWIEVAALDDSYGFLRVLVFKRPDVFT
ncbi:hypothetical protein GGI07_000307 [Coemansia sp. Benny D115]|nr:hypothetical protein GGI07_000307 [Coemansia sp. Benny D115]